MVINHLLTGMILQVGESSPRPVEYGALVLAHDALSGGFWCEVRLFGLGFGVRCAVFGLDFGAQCAVFGLDFGARYVVRRFWGRFRCTVRRFWARFWCAVRRFWARFWCAVGRFRCTVCLFGVVFGVRSAVFRLHFGARCVERRSWGRFRCTVRLFGFDFGALPFWDRFWCVVRWCWGRSQPAGNKIYQNMNILLFGALLGTS